MKKLRNCYVFVFDQYSDWEPALVTYGLHTFTDVNIITFSIDGQPVTSGGNLQIIPQQSLQEAMTADIDLLILPGGAPMEAGGHPAILPLIQQLVASGKSVAAICGATVFLAQHGYLDTIPHTSNHPDILKMMAPTYQGSALYVQTPAATGDNIITAAGTAMVAFATEIFTFFGLLENPQLQFWLGFFQGNADIPVIETASPLHFFYRRYETNLPGLLPLVRSAIKALYPVAIAAGLEICGAPEWHYHGFDGNPDTVFTLDIGLPVTEVLSVPAPYHCETLPVFDCVGMQHPGGWDKLGDTYGKLITGIQMLGIPMTGSNREQYLRFSFEHPEQNITNVQIGVSKA
ncbi:DJ-1/PfpI family protein [Chitinophaga nivalis]|uniref:DJ-1/PfpI family protein n=1 Tax=Chitinophaga nivalis TaxID=2991709 RepID=A0ABT3IU48_9BACT|nr:DJ-1/PfpI family protein [Chitinophaga nivalis]MCW3462829.1 DJ-1/PfpI family protein [Chitinophaga nivalis]MCW3487481.1 DJ-1/PfpI family protein [Chitinophaga nivalis]